jgi:adenosine deaminase
VVTINTDDPMMFGNSLALEYATLVSELGFMQSEIKQIILQTIQSTWLEDKEKTALKTSFLNDPNWK